MSPASPPQRRAVGKAAEGDFHLQRQRDRGQSNLHFHPRWATGRARGVADRGFQPGPCPALLTLGSAGGGLWALTRPPSPSPRTPTVTFFLRVLCLAGSSGLDKGQHWEDWRKVGWSGCLSFNDQRFPEVSLPLRLERGRTVPDDLFGGGQKAEVELPPLHLAERCLLSLPTGRLLRPGQQVEVLGWGGGCRRDTGNCTPYSLEARLKATCHW